MFDGGSPPGGPPYPLTNYLRETAGIMLAGDKFEFMVGAMLIYKADMMDLEIPGDPMMDLEERQTLYEIAKAFDGD